MVHQYKLNGYNIVLDTASGSVHAVDEVAYDIIEMYESKQKDEITAEILKKYADKNINIFTSREQANAFLDGDNVNS